MAKEQIVQIGSQKVKLSNLEKILFTEPDISKAEWIHYLYQINSYFLKYNSNRPLSLIRYPDGIGKEKFYTKNAPDWTPTYISKYKLGEQNYLTIQNPEDLIWIANLASLEIHITSLRLPYAQPDFIIFDLDPAENTSFQELKNLASNLKNYLEHLGYHPLLKTSGSKGLHIFVPIVPQWNTQEVITYTEEISKQFVADNFSLCTLRIRKDQRDGKILLDINRNHSSQTIIAPYSTRAIKNAPVSLPLHWSSLESLHSSQDYTIHNALKYIETYGDAWVNYKEKQMPLHNKKYVTENKAIDTKLNTYQEKRNFEITSEPEAKIEESQNNRFVIQLHNASNLHYDLRLEHEGVLWSWAIPKGLSLSEGIKRLAIRTEDHPTKYLEFEGIIPKEEYGGGQMWIIDFGKFEWIQNKSKSLQFKLLGNRIHGIFQMIEIEKDQWLIEMKSDFKPSIFDQQYKPMLAEQIANFQLNSAYTYEIKWDGIRVLIYIDHGEYKIISRNGRDITSQFPECKEICKWILVESAVLDAEIVCLDEKGKPIFANVISRLHSKSNLSYGEKLKKNPISIYAFDLLTIDQLELFNTPLYKRREWLTCIFQPNNTLRFSDSFEDGSQLLEAAKQLQLEGIMAKDLSSFYTQNSRSVAWNKIKIRQNTDCLILGFTYGQGDRSEYFGSLHIGQYEDDKLTYRGRVGTGFTQKRLAEIKLYLSKFSIGSKPVIQGEIEEEQNSVWLAEYPWIEIQYASMTGNGSFREPVFVGLLENIETLKL